MLGMFMIGRCNWARKAVSLGSESKLGSKRTPDVLEKCRMRVRMNLFCKAFMMGMISTERNGESMEGFIHGSLHVHRPRGHFTCLGLVADSTANRE